MVRYKYSISIPQYIIYTKGESVMKKLINFASMIFTASVMFSICILIARALPISLDIEMYLGILLLTTLAVLCVGAIIYAFTFTLAMTIISVIIKNKSQG